MDSGVSVGPNAERIDELGNALAFVELAVGEGERTRVYLDVADVADRAEGADINLVTHLPYRQPLSTPAEGIDDATLSSLEALPDDAAAMSIFPLSASSWPRRDHWNRRRRATLSVVAENTTGGRTGSEGVRSRRARSDSVGARSRRTRYW
jgi:hypothetical protein